MKINVEQLADRWISEVLEDETTSEQDYADVTESASDTALHLPYVSRELAWAFVDHVFAKTASTKVLGLLGAGILEELIALEGANSIPILEALIERHPLLAKVLNGVWQGEITDDVWLQVLRLRGK